MRKWFGIVCAAAALALVPGLACALVPDCPLQKAPYSSSSPLLDLLLNPQAKAILDEQGFIAETPAFFLKTTTPTFAAIVSLRTKPGNADYARRLDALDTRLAQIPVTESDEEARCARYDLTPPTLPDTLDHPAILVFDKINGFRDDASVDAAAATLRDMASRRGWTLVFSDDGAVFNDRDLRRFDAVVWNNVSGDALTLGQRAAFKAYIENGGGFAGIHGSGGDPAYFWDWYVDTLVGARFIGHPESPQFQVGRIVVDDPKSAILADVGSGWSMAEEWYSFKASPRLAGAHILLTLDEASYAVPSALKMGDHPIAWSRCIENGRSFYTALGHMPANYAEPHTVSLLEEGIAWAAGKGQTRCQAGVEVPQG